VGTPQIFLDLHFISRFARLYPQGR
jgi:hypothetical protein